MRSPALNGNYQDGRGLMVATEILQAFNLNSVCADSPVMEKASHE